MKFLYIFNLKQLYKNKKVWILMVIVLSYLIIFIRQNEFSAVTYEKGRLSMGEQAVYDANMNLSFAEQALQAGTISLEEHERIINNSNYYLKSGKQMMEAAIQGNWKVYNRAAVIQENLYENDERHTTHNWNIYKNYNVYEHMAEIDIIIKTLEIPDLNNSPMILAKSTISGYPYCQLLMRHSYWLYKHNLEPLNEYSINWATIPYHFLKYIAPILILIISGLLCFDLMQKEYEQGTMKLILSLGLKRYKIIVVQIAAFSTVLITILFFPVLICQLFYLIIGRQYDSFSMILQPILFNTEGLTDFLWGVSKSEFSSIPFGLELCQIPERLSLGFYGFFGFLDPHNALGWIELWKIICLGLILIALIAILSVLLITLIWILTRKKIVTLFIYSIICLICLIYSHMDMTSILNGINPLNYINSIDVLSGLTYYTWLSGIATTAICCIFLYSLLIYVFNRFEL